MLPQFYQTHLQQHLTQTQFLVLSLLLNVLQSSKQVKLEHLARMFPYPITIESRRRKLQRFLKLPQLRLDLLWYPLITYWLTTYCQVGQRLAIVIARTWRDFYQPTYGKPGVGAQSHSFILDTATQIR